MLWPEVHNLRILQTCANQRSEVESAAQMTSADDDDDDLILGGMVAQEGRLHCPNIVLKDWTHFECSCIVWFYTD